VRNLRTVIGEQILPVYTRALELTSSVLERLLGFAKEYAGRRRQAARTSSSMTSCTHRSMR
jgi:hypothetical protein